MELPSTTDNDKWDYYFQSWVQRRSPSTHSLLLTKYSYRLAELTGHARKELGSVIDESQIPRQQTLSSLPLDL
jgi:hypothetical protein